MCAFRSLYAWRDNIAREEDESTGWDLILPCILSSLFRHFLHSILLHVNNSIVKRGKRFWHFSHFFVHSELNSAPLFIGRSEDLHVMLIFLQLAHLINAAPLLVVENMISIWHELNKN